MGNIVAIVGRPNVGKSTLFNRLTGVRMAIVDEQSGVTRDRHYGHSEWNGKPFSVIDTGGYVEGSDDIFEGQINSQVKIALDEADYFFFVVDVKSGVTDLDEGVAKLLRGAKKPVFLVVNKVDNHDLQFAAAEFYSLGLGDIYNISSASGSGTGELLDALAEKMPVEEEFHDETPRIAVVGKPNVGKSSLINALLGEERNIVTDMAGTTRDALHTRYNSYGHDFNLVDTAGIRRKTKVHEDIEFYSVMRAVRAIENSDVCILMVDAQDGFQKQDLNIFYLIERNKKGVVVLINKWDLLEKETNTMKEMEAEIREKIAPFTDVPILFVSALHKQRIMQSVETAMEVYKNRTQRIMTSVLNEVMLAVIDKNPPPSNKGKFIKIKYVTQLPTHSPSFAFYCNLPQYIMESYRRYLENQLRANFELQGVPIRVFFRKK
ncbi:MAG: GTP-binding protein [Patiriisocius sp.]|jgi:GTP-binding protein